MAEPDLLIEAGFSDAKLAAEVSKLVAKYKQAGDAAQKAFKDSTDKVGDNQALRAHMRELDRLQRAYDPVYTATQKYDAAVQKLDRALKIGAIDQAKYTAEIKRAQVELGQVAGVIDQQVKPRLQGGADGFRNLGFQVQDFAVQVGAGTSATQAFAQQFPQLASGFGPVGVALGTAAAILVPLAGALFGAGEEAQTLEKQLEALEKSTDAMTAAAAAAAVPIEELRAKYGGLADEVDRANQAMAAITAATAKQDAVAAARRLGKEMGDDLPSLNAFLGPDGNVMPGYEGARAKLVDQAVVSLGKKIGATRQEALRLIDAISGLGAGGDFDTLVVEADALTSALAGVTKGTTQQQAALQAMVDQVKPIMGAATAGVAAGADTAIAAQDAVIAKYNETTTKLQALAAERALMEEAAKSADAARATAARDAIAAIDREIDKTRQLARETDLAYQSMTRAYQDYAASRTAGNEWAQSPAGFQAQYVAERAAGSNNQTEELVRATTALAEQLGVSARDLLAVMSFETGGKLRPDVMGPTTKNGQHFGLIQFGDKGAGPRYGVTPQSSITEQVIAAGKYLQDAGVKAGDSLANIYAAVLSGDARKIHASDLAAGGVVGNVTEATNGDQFAPHIARAEGMLAAYGGVVKEVSETERQAASDRQRELNEDIRRRQQQVDAAREYGEQLSRNLLTEQQTAQLEAQRAQAIAAINASGMTDADKAAAIAQVNAEMQRQVTIMGLVAESQRRGVDLDARMIDSTLTYRDAINALGDAQYNRAIADQQAAASADQLRQAQDFANQQTQVLKDGLVDAIVAGESFSDVLANVAQALAKAALQAALFNQGPMAGGGGAGLLGDIFKGMGSWFGGARAMGGPVSANTPYLVGERGPEIIVPRGAGEVIPNHKLGGGSGAVDVRVYMDEGGNWQARVEQISGRVTAQAAAANNKTFSQRVQRSIARPRERV